MDWNARAAAQGTTGPVARDDSPLRHPRPGRAPWVHCTGRWVLARRHHILVLKGHRQRRLARRWATAWARLHPPGHDGWLLLVPDTGSSHQCRVEGLPDGPVQRSVVLRVGQDQLRLALVGSGDVHRETDALEGMILRLHAAVCPSLPVVVEGLFDEASREWFAELARRHTDWWLSWRPGVEAGPGLRMVYDSPPRERRSRS